VCSSYFFDDFSAWKTNRNRRRTYRYVSVSIYEVVTLSIVTRDELFAIEKLFKFVRTQSDPRSILLIQRLSILMNLIDGHQTEGNERL